jgi:catechol 2,3-dioxygenase-like lactoylglutathione lyase family enzyme
MEIEFILYVADQERATQFYQQILQTPPALNVPGMTEFILAPGVKLGLMPENGIAKIIVPAAPHPNTANGVPRCELYLKYGSAKTFFDRALAAGATKISEVTPRDWGDLAGYAADPDGHIIAFAE